MFFTLVIALTGCLLLLGSSVNAQRGSDYELTWTNIAAGAAR